MHGHDAAAVAPGPGRAAQLAPLKGDLTADRRAFVEDLRRVFLTLGVSVRRYAARSHLDPGTVSRYLNGGRLPPWTFVVGLLTEVERSRAALTPDAEGALANLHAKALQDSARRPGRAAALQDRLAAADEETRRITVHRQALEDALQEREHLLAQHRVEHARLREDHDVLEAEAAFLREALRQTRDELLAAEERCHRLEAELDALEAVPVAAALEEAVRGDVPNLVRTVGDLERRSSTATAGDLVRFASRDRPAGELADLLAELRGAGHDAHARAALVAVAAVRTVYVVSALVGELTVRGLEEYTVVLLQEAVRTASPAGAAALVQELHEDGLRGHARTVAEAVAVTRPVFHVAYMTGVLAAVGLGHAAEAGARAAARRPVADLAELVGELRWAGLGAWAGTVRDVAATVRAAADVAQLVEMLARHSDSDLVLLRARERSADFLIAFVQALQGGRAWAVLAHAARDRPVDEVAALVSGLHDTGGHHAAADLFAQALHAAPCGSAADLVDALAGTPTGWEAVVRDAGRTLAPVRAADLLLHLDDAGLAAAAEVLFTGVVDENLAEHVGAFLNSLVVGASRFTRVEALRAYAGGLGVAPRVRLLCALDAATLDVHFDAILREHAEGSVREIVHLVRHLGEDSAEPRADQVLTRLVDHAVAPRSVGELAVLAHALETGGLDDAARLLARRTPAGDRAWFAYELERERRRHEPRVLTRAFWLPDPDRPGPVARWVRSAASRF